MVKQKIYNLLRWSEKYTKTDMVYLAHGGFWLNLTQVTGAILGLILTITFANLIPVETYGLYRYVLSMYSLIVIASLPGINTALTRSISRHMDGSFINAIKIKIKWGLLGSIFSLVFAVYKYFNEDYTLSIIFILVALFLPIMETLSLYPSFLNGKKLFKIWALVDVSTQIFSVLSLVTVLFITKNIFFIMLGYFIPIILSRVVATIFIKNNYLKNEPSDSELLPYGKSLTFYQIISRMISAIDQIALFHFLGPAQVAIFSLSMAIPNRVQSLFKATGILAFPKFTEHSKKEVVEALPKKMLWLLLVIIVVSFVYIAGAPFIFKYLFPKYLPSLIYSQAIIFFTISAITYPFSSYLLAHKKIRESYVFGIANLTVKAFTLAIFVPLLGIWGAVISVLSASVTTIIVSLILINREKRLS